MSFRGDSGNSYYPLEYRCRNGHNIWSNEHPKVKNGYKMIRTKTKEGFQTSHIPKEWEIPKDQDFHAVNLNVGFYSHGKT